MSAREMTERHANAIALPAGVRATPVALELPETLTVDEWEEVGTRLVDAAAGIMWWVGDWWAFGQHRYGARSKAVAERLHVKFQHAADAGWVSRKYETSDRSEVVPWTHHRAIAALPAPSRAELLQRAEQEEWSLRELKVEVARSRNRVGDEPSGETCVVDDLNAIIAAGIKCGTVYADPPWLYGNQATRASTDKNYDGMNVDAICALGEQVRQFTADKAHLHLWTTNAFLQDSYRVLDAWGFEYKSVFVWVKPDMGIGNYWRVCHEFMLLGVRGGLTFADHSLRSWLEVPRGEHSAKPEQVRALIEKAGPGPRLEMFARRVSPGWMCWGNEVRRELFSQGVRTLGEAA